MQSIFQYAVAYCKPKPSTIEYTKAYTGYKQSIFGYLVANYVRRQAASENTQKNKLSISNTKRLRYHNTSFQKRKISICTLPNSLPGPPKRDLFMNGREIGNTS